MDDSQTAPLESSDCADEYGCRCLISNQDVEASTKDTARHRGGAGKFSERPESRPRKQIVGLDLHPMR